MDSLHKFSVIIAGAGNVGSFLAVELFNAGCTISRVYSRTLMHANKLAENVNSVGIDDIDRLQLTADFLIIALPDRVIPVFLKQLHDSGKLDNSSIVILSTAGSIHIDELKSVYHNSGVLYPLQSFTKLTRPVPEIIPFCIEGSSEQVTTKIANLAALITNQIKAVNSQQRIILHLAAVFACNFTNHMIALADTILQKAELDAEILKPLINETILRLNDHLPAEMQTGPAVRNDSTTIEKHIKLLEELGYSDLCLIYKQISQSISKLNQDKS
ncbi:MAG: Rossmann-like and DUF2520 domain-containing protein [Chloroflexota bacterium]